MKLVYKGKTKDVFELENGNYLLKFKDDVTGADGVFDPGANQVGLTIEGVGKSDLLLSEFFFRKIIDAGYKTHFVKADNNEGCMEVLPASPFGNGIEVIARFKAVGSFIRRYGMYIDSGAEIEDGFIEITLKDDERNDPPITKDALIILGILTSQEYEDLKNMTLKVANIIKGELARKNLELYDIKLEFGRLKSNDEIVLIDEISGGNMRVYKKNDYIEPLELSKIMTS